MISALLERVREPEYVGENRCVPCTAVNVAIAGVATLVVGVLSPPVGLVVFGTSLALIYLRGYLVPGTPALTKRYFPDWLLRRFDKSPHARSRRRAAQTVDAASADTETVGTDGTTLDTEAFLVDVGALRESDDADDVALEESFERAWYHRIDALRDGDGGVGQLARTVGVSTDRLSLSDHGNAVAAWLDDDWLGQWESREAFAADMAASAELDDRVDVWSEFPVDVRGQLLSGLRACIERCPVCGGTVGLGTHAVESCCQSYDVVAATCEHCEVRYFEAEYDTVDGAFVD
ncbi:hypothetical protein AUR64_19195 [Haloprofundus marisrubri]|uniref:Uncharacterized protein n=1 Tax=Haloprofundus marisrubri TaxID=1514971 RepID=A0A0W1R4U6_9EURY|nr:hypothetical protein [Haloprofundus marisrubri]KTG08360.1 hypothetical protein AUR64_19195 [Haloprofundus marisrubri]